MFSYDLLDCNFIKANYDGFYYQLQMIHVRPKPFNIVKRQVENSHITKILFIVLFSGI